MEENELSQEEAQKLWNEEAQKLDAGDQTPAFEAQASVPDTPPQETPVSSDASTQEQAANPLAGLPEEVKLALGKITQLEQANAQLLHHVKTAEGRVAAMQREFQQGRQAATSVDAASWLRVFGTGLLLDATVAGILVVAASDAEPVLAALLNAGEDAFICGQLVAG